jgi:hypothetical protein
MVEHLGTKSDFWALVPGSVDSQSCWLVSHLFHGVPRPWGGKESQGLTAGEGSRLLRWTSPFSPPGAAAGVGEAGTRLSHWRRQRRGDPGQGAIEAVVDLPGDPSPASGS